MMSRATTLVCCALALASRAAEGQSLADRVRGAGDGAVTFTFASRPEVCGDGERSVRVGRSYMGFDGDFQRHACEFGPVQVRVTTRNGVVERVESWVGSPRTREGRALGTVGAAEAARFLLTLASRTEGGAAARAIAPAVFADSAQVWLALLAIARDPSGRRRPASSEAAFWLSRFAAAAIGGHPRRLDEDEDEGTNDVKVHAVFVLSQLPNHEGIGPLLDVARSNAAIAVRQRALFWLGQSGDPRAFMLFESLLRS
jgi:hypothetical protein